MNRINLSPKQNQLITSYVNSSVYNLLVEIGFNSIGLSINGFTFQLNAALRANLQFKSNVVNFLDEFDSIFYNHKTETDMIVYRVCNYLEMYRYITKDNYIDYGYMSTSKEIEITQQFYQKPAFGYFPAFLKINIPSNSTVLDLSNIKGFDNTTYEDEVLIKRKSKFKILTNKEVKSEKMKNEMGKLAQEEHEKIRVIELNFIGYLPDC